MYFRKQENHPLSQAKGWFSRKLTLIDNHHPDGRGCKEKYYQHFSFLYMSIIHKTIPVEKEFELIPVHCHSSD
jgi:hypothetical protein